MRKHQKMNIIHFPLRPEKKRNKYEGTLTLVCISLLSFLYEAKQDPLCGDHVSPHVCDTVSGTKTICQVFHEIWYSSLQKFVMPVSVS